MNIFKKSLTSLAGALVGLAVAASAQAGPITFDYSITHTDYRVDGTETAESLVNAHELGDLVCTGSVDGFVRVGPRQTCGVFQRNYSLLVSTQFNLVDGGNYRFQAGVDWGRGGGVILTDLSSGEQLLTDLASGDLWWNRDWNDSDVFISEFDLDPGAYALTWIGFEGCCAGETTVRYSYNGEAFSNLTGESFGQHATVSEPGTLFLLGLGLVGFVILRRRHGSFQAMRAEQKTASDAARGIEPLTVSA
jgi:hypothetical protein